MNGSWDKARRLGGVPLFLRLQVFGWLAYAILTLPLKALLYESIGYALLVTAFRESFVFLITSAHPHQAKS